MKKLNNKEIEKINSNLIYVFDSTKSNIDIIPFNYDTDISTLDIDDYYILIKNNNNSFETLSNNDIKHRTNIFINEDELVNDNRRFIFKSNINDSNLININEFLKLNGLEECMKDKYSDLDLKQIEDSLNQIRINNKTRRLSK